MKKIIINNADFDTESYDTTTDFEEMRYLVMYDDLTFLSDGQVMDDPYIAAFKYSVDAETHVVDYCGENAIENANGNLFVYEILDKEEVGFTPEKEKKYLDWWDDGKFDWRRYYKTQEEFVASMKEKDLLEEESVISLTICDIEFYVLPREVEYEYQLVAKI